MAFTVTFYNFSKRENSTARPSVTGTAYNVVLKDDCSVISPRFELQVTAMPQFNYCYCANFAGRYYFIKEWRWEKPFWVAYCEEDVLGTWRTSIGNSSQYILRSSHEWDLNVVDSTYPAKTGPTFAATNATLEGWGLSSSLSVGTYVLGTVNGLQGGTYGPVTYYAVSPSVMSQFMSYMLSQAPAWDSISDLSGDLAKAFIDPFQYIVSCKWFPFEITTTSQQVLCFGYWDSDFSGGLMNNATEFYKQWTFNMTRPPRADAGARGEWEYKAPFASYWLTLYPWGTVYINPEDIDADGIICNVVVDLINGLGTLRIRSQAPGPAPANNSQLLVSQQAQVGVDIQLSQITNNMISGVSNVVNNPFSQIPLIATELFGMATGSDYGTALGAQLSAKNSGSNQGIVTSTMLAGSAIFTAEYLDPVSENLADRGRPLMQIKQISDIPGFIICADGDIAIAGNADENRRIKQYMTGGFFYE